METENFVSILRSMHERISKLEGKTDFSHIPEDSLLKEFYEKYKKIKIGSFNGRRRGWELKPYKNGDLLYGQGVINGKTYSIEIEINYKNDFTVTCWGPSDGENEPDRLDFHTRSPIEVAFFLSREFSPIIDE